MEPIEFDGMQFEAAEVLANRETLIQLRDVALKMDRFDYAIALSHTIGILAVVAEVMKAAKPSTKG